MSKKELTMVDDLDMEMDVEEIEMSPEYVDMSAGTYYLRVAGFTKKSVDIDDPEGEDGDTISSTRRSIIFQIVGIKVAERPQPEIGGIFSQGGIMGYQIARDQFIRLVRKIVKLGDPGFLEKKHGMQDYCKRAMELFDRDRFLQCIISIRDEKYPNIRTMKSVGVEEVEDWDEEEFQFAEFEFVA